MKIFILSLVLLMCNPIVAQKNIENFKKDPLTGIGFWFDISAGGATFQEIAYDRIYIDRTGMLGNYPKGTMWRTMGNVNLKFGNKWYVLYKEKFQLGFQFTWMEGGWYPDTKLYYFNPGSLGFTSLLKFSKNTGLEMNLNIGPHIMGSNIAHLGAQANIETKFRFKYLSIGLNLSYSIGRFDSLSTIHVIGYRFSVGCKF